MDMKPRQTWIRAHFDNLLVAANGCLAVLAIMLAVLIFVQLEIGAWRLGDTGPGVSSDVPTGIATLQRSGAS